MKNLRTIFIALTILLAFYSVKVFAFGATTKQFGGRILTTTTPPVTCSSQYGIILISPARGSSAPGPFIIESTNKNVSSGGQILGKYETTMDYQTCYIQAGPYRIPVPTYKITKTFNTSSR